MTFKGVKCIYCGQDLGCPTCGQLLPDKSVVSVEASGKTFYFCNTEHKRKWMEEMTI